MTAPQLLRFRLPDLGEGVVETEIVRWLVAPGESLREDQPMVEVMTDKATVEIPAPATGVVERLHAEDGAVVAVGSVIVDIATDAPVSGAGSARAATRTGGDAAGVAVAAGSGGARTSAAGAAARVQATPLVRKVAAQLGIDLTAVSGTGPGGRITEADVRAAAGATPGTQSTAPTADDEQAAGATRTIALRGARGQIAAHLQRAAQVPTVTVVEEAELTAVDEARRASGLGYLSYIVQAVVAGLREVPELNATIDAERGEVTVHERIDLGIAVQTERGLVVPVLRDCADVSLHDLESRIADLAAAARDDSLAPADLRGGTFTITSAGRFGGLFTTPLLNVPQVGILGLHRAEPRAVVRDGDVVVRQMANLSITFDHRALDGIHASRFLLTTVDALHTPRVVT